MRGGLLTVLASGVSYSTEANALFAAMTSKPNATRKALIDATIKSLKASGAWALMDVLYLAAAHDQQAARLNWKLPGSFTLTAVGGGTTFTIDRGFKGDGVGTAEDTGYSPTVVGGSLFVQNSAHMGLIPTENVQSDTRCCGHLRASFLPRSSASVASCNGNSSSGDTVQTGQLTSQQHYTWYRDNAANFRTFINGVNQLNPARVSSAPSSTTWRLCSRNDTVPGYSVTQIGCFYAGGALTDQLVADIHTALSAYMTAIGAL